MAQKRPVKRKSNVTNKQKNRRTADMRPLICIPGKWLASQMSGDTVLMLPGPPTGINKKVGNEVVMVTVLVTMAGL